MNQELYMIEKKLFDICRPKQWKTIASGSLKKEGYPVYGANGIIGFYDNYNHEKPTILITCRGATCGTINVSKPFSYINGNAMALDDLNEEEANIDYLAYYLKFRKLNDVISGTAQPQITREGLQSLKIPLPPLPEQKRIAQILDKADELRQKRQQSIEKLEELLQATFVDMFGDPVSNPKGWETKPLKNLALKVQSGNTPKGGKENYLKEGITFFRSQNVWKNKIIYDDIAFIDEETHKKMLGSSLKHKDILMTKTGRINTENSSLGRAAIYLGEDDKANLNGHVYLIRLSEKVNPFFILSILTLPSYYEYIRSLCVGGIDKRQLNKEHIESFSIIYPPIELQDKFAKIKQNFEQQKQILIKQLEQQENLFQSLQQRAFNGEL